MDSNRVGIGMTSARTRERLMLRLQGEGINNLAVLEAMNTVPRHLFVDEALASRAYEDTALPIGHGQTISQPYIVAYMTQSILTGVSYPNKVLEVGTGCGYQAAVLAELVEEVCTVERIEPLFKVASKRLRELGYNNVHFKLSDGSWGWADNAPYDAILVAAAARKVPVPLLTQLAVGGRMVIPVGEPGQQDLLLYERTEHDFSCQRLEAVSFVPLISSSISPSLSPSFERGLVPA